MRREPRTSTGGLAASLACASALLAVASEPSKNAPTATRIDQPLETREQTWNWHAQNADIVQGDPGFPAQYSGPNSLNSQGEVRETVSLDLYAGVRMWRGAEAHVALRVGATG